MLGVMFVAVDVVAVFFTGVGRRGAPPGEVAP